MELKLNPTEIVVLHDVLVSQLDSGDYTDEAMTAMESKPSRLA